MLGEAQVHLLTWIGRGSLLERTDATGAGGQPESVMGGMLVNPADIEALESQGLIELQGAWTIDDSGYVRYGLTAFGLTVLQTYHQHGPP